VDKNLVNAWGLAAGPAGYAEGRLGTLTPAR
jgi:hypothetical protein